MLTAFLTALALPLRADEAERHERDQARRAVQRGEIRSLEDILASLRGKLPGEIAGVDIEREDGRWLYEFRVIDTNGNLFEVYVDPRTGTIERTKEK
ncbi:MAG: PepSY domain-containing protein [Hyphomicrobiaceae bacterium]